MIRLTTLADSKVIRVVDVQAEIERLTELWSSANAVLHSQNIQSQNSLSNIDSDAQASPLFNSKQIKQSTNNILKSYLSEDILDELDPFDTVQLAYVIEVCIAHNNQAATGRYLYANSRNKLKNPNDSDRLRKYLMKFGLKFDEL